MESSRNVDLPEDLVREILLRLPVKALLQCRCVSKEWCALIGSRSFIDGHYSYEKNPDCLLIQFLSDRSYSEDFIFAMCREDGSHFQSEASNYLSQMLTGGEGTVLLGPANGVFCVVRKFNQIALALFNPAKRKFKPLPSFPLPKQVHLEFGFGFDRLSGDYKFVAFEVVRKADKRLFYVYNSSRDSWRIGGKVEDGLCGSSEVVLNEVFHWMKRDTVLDGNSIPAFDMRSENLKEILVPDAIRETKFKVWITAYGDSVALLSQVELCVNLDLWVMGRDGLWTKIFSIANPPPLYMDYSHRVWNKNELLSEVHSHRSSLLLLSDISTQKDRRRRRIFRPEFINSQGVCRFFTYKESLVSIKGETGRDDCVDDFFEKSVTKCVIS